MRGLPLLHRELKHEARRRANFVLRFWLGAGAIAVAAVAFDRAGPRQTGAQAFHALHVGMVWTVLLVGPVLTADVISRERREGTLPLLFLTSIGSGELAVSKWLVQALRLASFCLVVLPVISISFLLGGAGPLELVTSLATQWICLLIAVSSGLYASSRAERFAVAVIVSVVVTVIATLLISCAGAFVTMHTFNVLSGRGNFDIRYLLVAAWMLPTICADPAWKNQPAEFYLAFSAGLATTLLLALAWMLAAFHTAARVIADAQRQSEPGILSKAMARTFLEPRYWRHSFRRYLARKMKSNPLIWLEYRNAWSRTGRWLVVLAVLVAQSAVLANYVENGSLRHGQLWIVSGLAILIAFTSAGSFHNERQTGAIELLLVAPFSDSQFVTGRLRAIFSYYTPAILLCAGFALVVAMLGWGDSFRRVKHWLTLAQFFSAFLSCFTIPIAGLFFSVTLRQFVPVLLNTVLAGFVLPIAFTTFLFTGMDPWGDEPDLTGVLMVHAGIATGFYLLTKGRFADRAAIAR